MFDYRKILRQRAMGMGIRNNAFSCKRSTMMLAAVVDRAKSRGLEQPLPEVLSRE